MNRSRENLARRLLVRIICVGDEGLPRALPQYVAWRRMVAAQSGGDDERALVRVHQALSGRPAKTFPAVRVVRSGAVQFLRDRLGELDDFAGRERPPHQARPGSARVIPIASVLSNCVQLGAQLALVLLMAFAMGVGANAQWKWLPVIWLF